MASTCRHSRGIYSVGFLWLEQGALGQSQSSPMQVDGKVIGFQAINSGQALVLGSDGNLWLEATQTGAVPPPRTLLSANVRVTF